MPSMTVAEAEAWITATKAEDAARDKRRRVGRQARAMANDLEAARFMGRNAASVERPNLPSVYGYLGLRAARHRFPMLAMEQLVSAARDAYLHALITQPAAPDGGTPQ